jgi:hypothetical protein
MIEELENNGFYKFESKIEKSWISKINNALPEIFKEHELLRRKNGNPITSEGLAMNALVGNPLFFTTLNRHRFDKFN